MDYEKAESTLGKRQRRKLANHTYLERRGEHTITIKLHATDIITFYPDKVRLDSGGWRTPTTKDRLNHFLPSDYRIICDRSIWHLYKGSEKVALFRDGLEFDPSNPSFNSERDDRDTQQMIKLRRRIDDYAKKFVEALVDGNVPAPSNGDCWYCLMRVTDDPAATKTGTLNPDGSLSNQANVKPALQGATLGEVSHDTSHILSHIEENYFVGSLLIRALEKRNVGPAYYWDLQAHWEAQHDRPLTKWMLSSYRRWLKSYLYSQLNLGR
jgi:hypothetical protein